MFLLSCQVNNGNVSVSGSATIDLGIAGTNDYNNLLMQANGSFSAGSLTLSGSAKKAFAGTVTTSGNLIIEGSKDDGNSSDSEDGYTTFTDSVTVGGDLILRDNASARIDNHATLSVAGNICIGDATLTYARFTTAATDDLGTIYVTANGAQLNVDSLTRLKATISSQGNTAYDFTIGDAPREFAATLSNLSNLSVEGGSVTLTSASAGQLSGSITVSGNANLTLECDNIFSTAATGNISALGGTLNLGTSTQSFNGDLSLSHGSITGADGSSLIANSATSLSYSGGGNVLAATLKMGSKNLTIYTAEEGSTLKLAGDITGAGGSMTLTGAGTTTISTALSYTGSVQVEGGAVLALDDEQSLQYASGITVSSGATIDIIHNGSTTQLDGYAVLNNGSGGSVNSSLLLEDGARINFTNLSGLGGITALTLTNGKLLFGGNVTFSFIETEEGKKLENLHTYSLVASDTGIDQAPGTTAGTVTVYANGKDTPLASDQYEFGYMNANGIRYFTFTMLAGKNWCGGASGDWHEMADGDYVNWTEGAVGDVALFRQQGTDADGKAITDVSILLSKQSGANGLYMDGSTNYTIYAQETSDMTAAFANTSDLIKKGSGTMTWQNIPLNLADVNIGEGTVALTDGSVLTSTGTITISPASYDSTGTVVTSARLTLDSSSSLLQGEATLSSYGTSTAELQGVTIANGSITGQSTTLSTTTPTITNASFSIATAGTTKEGSNGYTLSNLALAGTGTLDHTTLGAGVTISGTYTLGDAVTVTSTVTNTGTIKVTSDTILGIGRMESSNGTYTVFSGGSYEGWSSLSTTNFRVHGTLLSAITGVSVNTSTNGKVTITTDGVSIIDWDTAWGIDSWDAPTAGVYHNTSNTSSNNSGGGWGNNNTTTTNNVTVATSSDTTYQYSQTVSGGDSDVYVIAVGSEAGAPITSSSNQGGKPGNNNSSSTQTYYSLVGTSITSTSSTSPIDVWIYDEGSQFQTYVAGSATSGDYYGDTHLHITGELANASTIVGASTSAAQHGDSYLTIEAGTYNGTDDLVVAGSSGSVHYGDSLLHISGGTFGTVYGGTYNSYTSGGDTGVIVDGGTITTLYGGDYSTSTTTHTGNVSIELCGGSITNVYGGGGGSNKLAGNSHITLHATSGTMDTTIGSTLDGGYDTLTNTSTYHSALSFADAGSYDLEDVTITNFSHMELVEGAEVTVYVSRFNSANALTITGPGTVTIKGNSDTDINTHYTIKTGDLYLEGGATLKTQVYEYGYYAEETTTDIPAIYVASGSTMDMTGYPAASSNSLCARLYLAGDGTDGQGALYKGNTDEGDQTNKVELPFITLTANASVGVGDEAAGSAGIYMIPYQVTQYRGELDLQGGESSIRGYIFTKQGSGTFGMFNTDVKGGTINVTEGTFFTNYSSEAGDTDLVLHAGSTLGFGAKEGNNADKVNSLSIETLSGEGTVSLGGNGRLYIETDQGHADFANDFGSTPQQGQLFWNDKGYEYAVFSGDITGSGEVHKAGSGTQEFSGSASTYTGNTIAEGGILYLTGTTSESEFAKAVLSDDKLKATTSVSKGVVGTAALQWQGGTVYLGDGTRIYNESLVEYNSDTIRLGVDAEKTGTDANGNDIYSYANATYSGVISTEHDMTKLGLGTLTFDQLGSIAGGISIEEGTLRFYGWANAENYTISQAAGSTLMLAYDNSYEEEDARSITQALTISGTGATQWKSETNTDGRTAALISDIGAAVNFDISGPISDGTASGNVLHSGEGTLTLSGANSYSGGTTVTDGKVIVANNTGLGATANGGTANLVTLKESILQLNNGVETTLAASKKGTYAGNDIRGTVILGTEAENADSVQLNMTGNGYYATRTELEANATLVFCGPEATNWDGKTNTTGKTDMAGAGTLAGSGVVAVSDASGKGTTAYFQVTAALPEDQNGYAGDLVVEGDNTLLHIQGGKLEGGNFSVSGYGARLDAKRSEITVQDGNRIELNSLGDADSNPDSTACLAAYRVEVEAGGTLSAARAATDFQYNELGLEDIVPLINSDVYC